MNVPQECYLVMAHCKFDDYPVSLHGDPESAIQAAGSVTPESVGECARITESRNDASAIEPITISITEFVKGKPIRVHLNDNPQVVRHEASSAKAGIGKMNNPKEVNPARERDSAQSVADSQPEG